MSAGGEFIPSPEQRRAIEARGFSVALGAGAGCGKTAVLTHRFLGELGGDDRRPLREIVALTFTEKAARELRGRVREACRGQLDHADDPAEIDHWRRVVRGLEAAPIGTFHGFCRELLLRHAVEAGLDPQFGVLEESVAPTLRDRALSACVRRWLAEGDADLFGLAVEFGLPRVRLALADLVADRAKVDLPTWAARGVREVVDRWDEVWRTEVRPGLIEEVRTAWAPMADVATPDACKNGVMRDRLHFLAENLPRLTDADDPLALLRQIGDQARVQGGGTKKDWPSTELYELVKDNLAKLRKAVEDVRKKIDEDAAATAVAAELGLKFARLTHEAVAAYDRAKRAAGLLDFDDLLLRTRDLLIRSESVRAEAVEAIGLILVDEFQDTDPIQADILTQLADAGLDSGRLYLVGDRKQSIYRFRRAEPQLFAGFRDRFPADGRLPLRQNRRSVPGIIDFVNVAFESLYEDEDESLQTFRDHLVDGGEPAVTLIWAREPDDRPKVNADARRRVEARWLARHLAARLRQDWPVHDRDSKATRQARPGDVAILFRTLNDAAAYESALAAEGLDYQVSGGAAFFAQQEILDLVNLLGAIEDPLDPLTLAASLRSPFFGVSDEGLFWLADAPGSDLVRTFHERADGAESLSPADRAATARARDLLGRWRSLKDRVPIAELVARVLEDSGYEAALLGEFLGDRKRANGRKLVRLARRFDAQGGYTLADFVEQLRANLRKPPREDQAATADEQAQAIQLMTIHAAKGLEFPIVAVPDLDRDLVQGRDWVAFHPQLGPLVRPPDDDGTGDAAAAGSGRSIGWDAYRHLESRAERDEADRLFYVAATRARDWLILSAGLGPDEDPSSPALRRLDARFDRRTGDCKAPPPGGLPAPRVRVLLDPPAPVGPAARRPRPPRLRALARLIERSAPAEPIAANGTPTPPRPGMLDLDPAAGLRPALARLDALIRAVLADPAALHPDGLDAAILRAGRALVPAASPRLRDEAHRRLAKWTGGKLARTLDTSVEVRRAIPWAVAWPPGDPDAMVVVGRLEFAYRNSDGEFCLVTYSDADASPGRERLRLLLSARAAAALDMAPVAHAWRFTLGEGSRPQYQGEESFDDATLAAAFAAALAEPRRDRPA